MPESSESLSQRIAGFRGRIGHGPAVAPDLLRLARQGRDSPALLSLSQVQFLCAGLLVWAEQVVGEPAR